MGTQQTPQERDFLLLVFHFCIVPSVPRLLPRKEMKCSFHLCRLIYLAAYSTSTYSMELLLDQVIQKQAHFKSISNMLHLTNYFSMTRPRFNSNQEKSSMIPTWRRKETIHSTWRSKPCILQPKERRIQPISYQPSNSTIVFFASSGGPVALFCQG